MSGVMKTIDQRERQKKNTERKKGVMRAIVQVRKLKDFPVRLS